MNRWCPKNIKDTFHDWASEILGQGVHIHSKVIVLDPFGENPVVMTGSHNLGLKASSKNDDNLIVIQGNKPLAAAYAANIIAIYQSYRWNAYVEAHRQDPKVWHGLVNRDDWQDGYLTGDELAELTFWMGAYQPVSATVTPLQQIKHVPEHTAARRWCARADEEDEDQAIWREEAALGQDRRGETKERGEDKGFQAGRTQAALN